MIDDELINKYTLYNYVMENNKGFSNKKIES
jgi:hypothetical protein